MNSSVRSWVSFIGLIILTVGIYGSIRTVINLLVFEKYPTGGVIHLDILTTTPTYNAKETDCFYYPVQAMPTYGPNGEMILPSPDTTPMLQQENCLKGQAQDRKTAKVDDVARSALFLILGLGLLSSQKFLKKLD